MPTYATTTRATLRSRIQERLISTFWTNTEINAYINEALRVWNVCTGYNKNTYTNNFAANTFGYSISAAGTNAMFVLRVENAAFRHLDPITIKELGNLDPNWVSNTSTSPTNWMHVGVNSLFIYPTPSTLQTGLTTYTIDTFQVPTQDSDFIQIGEEDLQYIVDYCVFIARLKEGGKEAQESVTLLQGFLLQAAKYNSKILQTSLYKRVMGTFSTQTRNPKLEHQTV